MTEPDHTYIFQEALWTAEGTYRDTAGAVYPVEGESTVSHGADSWSIEGNLRLFGDERAAFVTNCRVEPFAPAAAYTSWVSDSPHLGRMEGRFAVVEDVILSHFRSDDGRCGGSECFRRIDAHTYRGRGVLYRDGSLVSSWAVNWAMRRETGGKRRT
jgi:hypothetical protein